MRDLTSWVPATPGREARLRRFSAMWESYQARYGAPSHVVKVAGTAGKGSVAAMLSAALTAAGKRAGLFTSPHLVDFKERIRIGDEIIGAAEFEAAFEEVRPLFACGPSFFEAMLITALRAFARAGVDIVILEAGVGGYNDVVSVVPAGLSIITSVGLDHVDELGSTIEEIARDKAGIASPGSTLVLGPATDARAVEVIASDARGRGVTIRSARTGRCDVRLPLRGAFQRDNLGTVLCALECLHDIGFIADTRSIEGVANTNWPARLELFEGATSWLIDAGHNLLAFEAVADFLRSFRPEQPKVLAFGTSEQRKAIEGLRVLAPLVREVVLVNGFYRAVELSPLLPHLRVFPTPDALVAAGHAGALVVVTGSVFLAGACRKLLLDRQ